MTFRAWSLIVSACAIAAVCVVFYFTKPLSNVPPSSPPSSPITADPPSSLVASSSTILGTSVEGRPISVATFGSGDTHLLFVGGIHGGYEWNSVLLAYEFIDYFTEHPNAIPAHLTVSVIPSLNPDGVYRILKKEGRFTLADAPRNIDTSQGRFNANSVDLNRNFDCKWAPTSRWRGRTVSAGTQPFSEPEARALRDFILETKLSAVVFWHSKANAVYASECEDGILPKTLDLMNAYARAARYTPIASFDSYPITGDAEGWLASIGIPAITVELETHETVEWERNLAGVRAVFEQYPAPQN